MAEGINWDLLGTILGQSAQAIAPDEIGGRLGAAGVQANRSNILEKNRQELVKLLSGLTVDGAETDTIKMTPEGDLKISGTMKKSQDVSDMPTMMDNPTGPQGGGNQSQSPFYNLLGYSGQGQLLG